MAFGVTDEGFNRKRLADIKDEIEESLKASLGNNINLLPESVFGQIIGVFSEREDLLWQLAEAVYFSQYPSTASGVSLDRVAEISGVSRRDPSESTITDLNQILFGTAGTNVTIGSLVSVDGNPDAVFETLASVTLVAGADEVQTLTLSATPTSGSFEINFDGEVVTAAFDDDEDALQAKFDAVFGAGIIAVSGDISGGGPVTLTFTGDDADGYGKRPVAIVTITSNTLDAGGAVTVTPTETTPGVVQGEVNMQAVETGPTVANTGTLTVIDTPISGWDATMNLEDANVGQGDEEDPDFRVRRIQQIARAGAATPNAILADVLEVNDVTAVVVFQNNLAITDLDGRPPHSVDIVVQNGDEDEIAQAIFDTVGAGITFVGDITKTVKDDQNFDQTIKFSRPTEIDIWVEMDLTVDVETFPVDGTDQVEEAILAYAALLGVGDDVIVHGSDPSLECSINDVPGIVDIVIRVGTAVSPTTDDNVDIDPREIADFDSARITVAVV